MAIVDLTDSVAEELIGSISYLTTFIQAIGGLILLYIIFNIINVVLNRKRKKQLELINKNLEEIKKILRKKK